jgi:hypothetical protein
VRQVAASLTLVVVAWGASPDAGQRSPVGAGRAQRPDARPAPREAAVPFRVGETLSYDVSWSSFVVAGTATVRVTEKRPSYGSTAYYIVVEGRPVPLVARLYNLFYKMDTLLDSVTLLSQRGSLYSEEGGSHALGVTRFDRGLRRAFFERQAETLETSDLQIPPGTQDGLAVLYALRGRTFKSGERFSVPIADGGSLYSVQVAVGALEPVGVPAGRFSAWNLKVGITDAQGQPVWRNNEVWIANDARRLPVKLQAELPVGHFLLVLRETQ